MINLLCDNVLNNNHLDTMDKYHSDREAILKELYHERTDMYPHFMPTTHTFASYRKEYDDEGFESELDGGTPYREYKKVPCGKVIDKEEVIVSLAGRIQEKRAGSKKLFFYTMMADGISLQIMANFKVYVDKDEFVRLNRKVFSRGDIIWARGYPARTKKGELSIVPLEMKLLAPSFREIQKQAIGMADPVRRVLHRHMDMLTNPKSRDTFRKRSQIVSFIRRYLENNGFLEVETSILESQAGGATAKPFVTHHNNLRTDYCLRIAPELALKKLIVGGFDRVFEIGKQFRNESIDSTHNPEFTSLEYYQAYADYNVLMKQCEDMLSSLVLKICGDYKVKYLPMEAEKEIEIDFTPPFRVVDMMSELKKHIGEIPKDFSSDEANKFFSNKCDEQGITVSSPRTTSRLIDKLVGHFIEDKCVNPTFVINHPAVMSPLAKYHRENPQLTERFELFVAGFELSNAYTELNDPIVQLERFREQLKAKEMGDDEAHGIDETFMEAMFTGMPPTGGFGLGIDRLVMILTNNHFIRDVILFPKVVVERKKAEEETK